MSRSIATGGKKANETNPPGGSGGKTSGTAGDGNPAAAAVCHGGLRGRHPYVAGGVQGCRVARRVRFFCHQRLSDHPDQRDKLPRTAIFLSAEPVLADLSAI